MERDPSPRPFFWIDAFTTTPGGGNPCAVVLDADGLADAEMLRLAQEMGLSETAFLVRSSRADFGARYFTPEREIPLAGHPTISLMRSLLEAGRIPRGPGSRDVTLELPAGVIRVRIDGGDEPHPRITMFQQKPKFLAELDPAEVLPVFGLAPDDRLEGAPIQVVSTGTPMLMIPVRGPDALRRIEMDGPAYRRLQERAQFFSPHLFCLGGATAEGAVFARHPGPPPDNHEDPFTGSATGCMGAYLWHHRLIGSPRFVAEQGHWMGRPGKARVEVFGPPDAIESVSVSGQAVALIRGEIRC